MDQFPDVLCLVKVGTDLEAKLRGRAAMTSDNPPTFDHAATSVATNTVCRPKSTAQTINCCKFRNT